MAVNGYKFTALTGGGAGALDAQDGAGLGEGDIAIVMASGTLYLYQLSASSGATESSPNVIAPDANAGTKRWLIQRVPQTNTVPIGTVILWIGGYFTNGSNGGFTSVLGNTPAAFNTLYNADGYYAANGALLNLSGSGCFNGAGRYLPNCTNDVFLLGGVTAGVTGGTNSSAHTHSMSAHYHNILHTHSTGSYTLSISEMPNHTHTMAGSGNPSPSYAQFDGHYLSEPHGIPLFYTGGSGAHNHGTTGSSITNSGAPNSDVTGASSATDNRPNFLSVIVGIKVI